MLQGGQVVSCAKAISGSTITVVRGRFTGPEAIATPPFIMRTLLAPFESFDF